MRQVAVRRMLRVGTRVIILSTCVRCGKEHAVRGQGQNLTLYCPVCKRAR